MNLTKTLVFQLDIDCEADLLHQAYAEARWVYNETVRLAKTGLMWTEITAIVEDEAALVKNTTQRIVAKAYRSYEQYLKHDDYNVPSHTKSGSYPLRMNFTEGYNLSIDGEKIRFRVSTKPYKPVSGVLRGSRDSIELLRNAIESKTMRVGTAEAMERNGQHELHITITNPEATVRHKENSKTSIGVDINEDCIALVALTEEDICDSVVIDYTDIKSKRHRYLTIRKRMQKSGQTLFHRLIENKESRYVHDKLHKLSRLVVEWAKQFEKPLIVFEDLKHMRDSINYGTRMNRRLHSLPFNKLRSFVTYKAAFQGIPSDEINPAYTSQQCSLTECEHTDRKNRRRKRFKCQKCGRQDHADRNASLNIAKKGLESLYRPVPALKTIPNIRKLRL